MAGSDCRDSLSSPDNPNMNLPCQICVVKEDKEPLQSLPATDILDQSEGVLKMCPALIMSASMPILRPVFYSLS